MLRSFQILVRSQICFAEQAIYLSRVKASGAFVVEPGFSLLQKVERLPVTFVLYACIRQQPQGIRLIQQSAHGPFLFQALLNLGDALLKLTLLGGSPSAQN